MRKSLIYFGLIIYLFLTNSVGSFIGLKQVGTSSSIILLLCLFITVDNKRILQIKKYFPNEINLIVASIIILIFQFVRYKNVANDIVFSFLVPLIILFSLAFENNKFKNKIQYIIIFFFFVDCILAMYERYTGLILFPEVTKDGLGLEQLEAKWAFRSNALLGHPLENALVLSIILGFILCGEFKKTFKIFCLIMGFIAFLCFNARGATMVWTAIGAYYIFRMIIDKSANFVTRSFLLIASTALIFGIMFLMFNTDLGGRLVNEEKVLDGSAQTRLQVYSAFNFVKFDDFIFGNPFSYMKVTHALGAGGVENPYIVCILNYGIFCASFLFIYLFKIIKRYFSLYATSDRIILFLSFIVLGAFNCSMNDAATWKVFFLCVCVFVRNKNDSLKKKISEDRTINLKGGNDIINTGSLTIER